MDTDLDAYRQKSLETWDEMASGWEARNEWMTAITGVVNEWIVAQVDPRPGQTVLDLAAGPGDLGFRVAERVGDGGHVLSTDFSPEMVAAARRIGDGRGLTNVEYRVLDAERMDLDDESADAIVCRWGYMLMADPAAALRESRRVVHRGGPVAFAVWATPERNPWAALPAKTLVERGHLPAPEPGAPGIFALADPGRIRALVTGAGFGEPELEEIAFDFDYADFEDFWEALVRLAGPLARALKPLPEDELAATRAAIEASLAPFRQEDGSYVAPALCLGVLAR
ncbi:MAG TPA: class I SAM-dependent methyltransferase [Solirubrobacterales bacterium]|jgi:ubiquinone/menaquinone biosynthesis C-methylase UbiE